MNNLSPSAAITDFLEIGPHSALKGLLANISQHVSGTGSVEY